MNLTDVKVVRYLGSVGNVPCSIYNIQCTRVLFPTRQLCQVTPFSREVEDMFSVNLISQLSQLSDVGRRKIKGYQ